MATDNDEKPYKKAEPKEEGTIVDVNHIDDQADADYIPEGFESVCDFLKDMREEYEADVAFDDFNRKAALDDKKFSAGEQ